MVNLAIGFYLNLIKLMLTTKKIKMNKEIPGLSDDNGSQLIFEKPPEIPKFLDKKVNPELKNVQDCVEDMDLLIETYGSTINNLHHHLITHMQHIVDDVLKITSFKAYANIFSDRVITPQGYNTNWNFEHILLDFNTCFNNYDLKQYIDIVANNLEEQKKLLSTPPSYVTHALRVKERTHIQKFQVWESYLQTCNSNFIKDVEKQLLNNKHLILQFKDLAAKLPVKDEISTKIPLRNMINQGNNDQKLILKCMKTFTPDVLSKYIKLKNNVEYPVTETLYFLDLKNLLTNFKNTAFNSNIQSILRFSAYIQEQTQSLGILNNVFNETQKSQRLYRFTEYGQSVDQYYKFRLYLNIQKFLQNLEINIKNCLTSFQHF